MSTDVVDLHMEPQAGDGTPAGSKLILVVDDAITVRLFYRKVLEEAGYRVEEAVNGLEGLEKVMTLGPDLLVVDINMPKMDGYQMLRLVRGDPATRAVPALMVSTESQPQDTELAFVAGANFYIPKPVRPLDFLETVRLMTGQADV